MKHEPLQVGDTIAVEGSGHSPGSHDATASVLEVFPESDTDSFCYRVSWPTGLETIYRPGRDAQVVESADD